MDKLEHTKAIAEYEIKAAEAYMNGNLDCKAMKNYYQGKIVALKVILQVIAE